MPEQWTFSPVFADWNFPYTIEIKEGEEVVATLEGGRVTCMGGDSANNAKVAKCLDRAKTIVREHNSHAALVEALEAIMTGGNHLALHITNSFGEHPPHDATLGDAQKFYKVGVPGWDGNAWKYDVWICWRAIMQARKALAQAKGGACDVGQLTSYDDTVTDWSGNGGEQP